MHIHHHHHHHFHIHNDGVSPELLSSLPFIGKIMDHEGTQRLLVYSLSDKNSESILPLLLHNSSANNDAYAPNISLHTPPENTLKHNKSFSTAPGPPQMTSNPSPSPPSNPNAQLKPFEEQAESNFSHQHNSRSMPYLPPSTTPLTKNIPTSHTPPKIFSDPSLYPLKYSSSNNYLEPFLESDECQGSPIAGALDDAVAVIDHLEDPLLHQEDSWPLKTSSKFNLYNGLLDEDILMEDMGLYGSCLPGGSGSPCMRKNLSSLSLLSSSYQPSLSSLSPNGVMGVNRPGQEAMLLPYGGERRERGEKGEVEDRGEREDRLPEAMGRAMSYGELFMVKKQESRSGAAFNRSGSAVGPLYDLSHPFEHSDYSNNPGMLRHNPSYPYESEEEKSRFNSTSYHTSPNQQPTVISHPLNSTGHSHSHGTGGHNGHNAHLHMGNNHHHGTGSSYHQNSQGYGINAGNTCTTLPSQQQHGPFSSAAQFNSIPSSSQVKSNISTSHHSSLHGKSSHAPPSSHMNPNSQIASSQNTSSKLSSPPQMATSPHLNSNHANSPPYLHPAPLPSGHIGVSGSHASHLPTTSLSSAVLPHSLHAANSNGNSMMGVAHSNSSHSQHPSGLPHGNTLALSGKPSTAPAPNGPPPYSISISTPHSNINTSLQSANSNAPSGGRKKLREECARGDDVHAFDVNIENIRSGIETRTTVMVRNIPNRYTQKLLLEKINQDFHNTFDFFYLPVDSRSRCNVGYAFINFIDNRTIVPFIEMYENKKWERFNSEKKCSVKFARIQGLGLLLNHFVNATVMQLEKRVRPLFRGDSLGILNGGLDEEPEDDEYYAPSIGETVY